MHLYLYPCKIGSVVRSIYVLSIYWNVLWWFVSSTCTTLFCSMHHCILLILLVINTRFASISITNHAMMIIFVPIILWIFAKIYMLAALTHLHWRFGYLFSSSSFYLSWCHTCCDLNFQMHSLSSILAEKCLIYHYSISTTLPMFTLGYHLELLLFWKLKLYSISQSLTSHPTL